MIDVSMPKEDWWVLIRALVAQGSLKVAEGDREAAQQLSNISIAVTSQVSAVKMFDQIEGELNGDQ